VTPSDPVLQDGLSGLALLNALKALVSRSPMGMCVLDSKMRFQYINQALADINGRSIEAHIGSCVADLVPEIYASSKAFIERAIASQVPIVDQLVEGATAAKPGVTRAWLQSWYPIVAQNGESLVAVIVRDVTDERRLEQELRDAAQRKDEFLAILAHELRNPLAPLTNVVELLKSVDNDIVRRAHAILNRQTVQLVRLVDDLMDASRIASGKIGLQRRTTKLQDVLLDAVTNAGAVMQAAMHDLVVDVPPDPIWVEADPVRLTQVVCNLLNNAAKYTPGEGRITLSVSSDGAHVVVEVRDTGVGIAQERLEEIFSMFTQAAGPSRLKLDGLGIGLWLAKTLAAMHGGTLVASSPGPGEGATFTLRLPVAQAPVKDDSALPVNCQLPAPHRVLIVDDNLDSAESLKQLLTLQGQHVSVANNGSMALELAAAFRPDLILLDIGLPDIIGWAVAARIRNESWGNAPVIAALTGYGQAQHRELSNEAGIDLHITKPLEIATLNKLLHAAGRREARAIGMA